MKFDLEYGPLSDTALATDDRFHSSRINIGNFSKLDILLYSYILPYALFRYFLSEWKCRSKLLAYLSSSAAKLRWSQDLSFVGSQLPTTVTTITFYSVSSSL